MARGSQGIPLDSTRVFARNYLSYISLLFFVKISTKSYIFNEYAFILFMLIIRQFYDEKGLLISNKEDICDCLRKDCPGCHFPCKQCSATKCGAKCRVKRTWYFEKVEIDGLNTEFHMPDMNSHAK